LFRHYWPEDLAVSIREGFPIVWQHPDHSCNREELRFIDDRFSCTFQHDGALCHTLQESICPYLQLRIDPSQTIDPIRVAGALLLEFPQGSRRLAASMSAACSRSVSVPFGSWHHWRMVACIARQPSRSPSAARLAGCAPVGQAGLRGPDPGQSEATISLSITGNNSAHLYQFSLTN
jgi:hypothetical protein